MLTTPRIFAFIVMFVWYFPLNQMWWITNNTEHNPQSLYKILSMDLYSALWLACYSFLCFVNNPRGLLIGIFGNDFFTKDSGFKEPGPMIILTCIFLFASPMFWIIILGYWGWLLISGGFPKFWKEMLFW